MQKKKFFLEFEKPILELEERIAELRQTSTAHKVDVAKEITALEEKLSATRTKIFHHLTPWQRVQLARHPQRPYSLDYFKLLFDDFQELHGDRLYMDDESTIGGIAFFEGEPLVLIGQQKGRDLKENLRRNFGCPNPEGYRKALRLMRLADTFQLPLVTFVDTPGAYPGTAGEERHVAEAIAANLREMSGLGVPIVSIVIGEGGSGGALGIAVADRILILENAYYSVISPEGCAAILWKDKAHAPAAAESLKLDAVSLQKLGVVDEIISEPLGGAQENIEKTAGNIRATLHRHLKELKKLSTEKLRDSRYAKYREIGVFAE